MAIGRNFAEALQKALRSLEQGRAGFGGELSDEFTDLELPDLWHRCEVATPERIFALHALLARGVDLDEVHARTRIDPWFLDQLAQLVTTEQMLAQSSVGELTRRQWRHAKQSGFTDGQIATLTGSLPTEVRRARELVGIHTVFKTVDTCAAEFTATTPYHYSSYDDETEVATSARDRVIILGSGPNRIGQGIEFDYCCVHASSALREMGYESVMVNCNPETVSTDYSTSDRLYFEPLTPEDVSNVIEAEQRASVNGAKVVGVIVALGGQTPLKLAQSLDSSLILGTSVASIDSAEDRQQWSAICHKIGVEQPPGDVATNLVEAQAVVATIGYPVLVRPSYVLGGRAMEIVYDDESLARVMADLTALHGSLAREGAVSASRPVLIDRFLEDAIEVDVDAVRDHVGDVYIAGVMEHVEEAGVHSGDSACALPPQSLSDATIAKISSMVEMIAHALEVVGLINVQFAVKGELIYVIEANPRASRTVPFVAKATGVAVVTVAVRAMLGHTLASMREAGLVPERTPRPNYVSVKEAVLPFNRFPNVDTLLGPEMRSTGEVMGIGESFGIAFAKAQLAAGTRLPHSGTVFLSLADRDKAHGLTLAGQLRDLGFDLAATAGTATLLEEHGITVAMRVSKVGRPDGAHDAVELISQSQVQLVINTPSGRGARADGAHIRAACVLHQVPCLTTVAAGLAAARGIADTVAHGWRVRSLQELHQ